MISQKKLEANRRNAQKSTGPKTPEGKARSSQNGLTHGLTSKKWPILRGEDEAEYEQFHDAMVCDLQPRGIMQYQIVQDLIQVRWKMKRLPKIEAESMRRHQQKLQERYEKHRKYDKKLEPPNLDPIQLLTDTYDTYGSCSSNIDLYRQRLQREMHTLLRELRKLREETGNEEQPCEECSGKTEPTETEDPVLKTKATEEHRRDAHATEAVCKTEPTEPPNPLLNQDLLHANPIRDTIATQGVSHEPTHRDAKLLLPLLQTTPRVF
jgi:hypothetical protein